jgi:NADH-quinone oxidoreductase subunit J
MESPAADGLGRVNSDGYFGIVAVDTANNMAPVATPFFFYLFAGIMLIGGILVITRKNPVHSALALIITLLAQASIYLMLYAPFVAGVQIILYAGGIMVLFLFVIMLVSIEQSMKERQFNSQWVVGVVAAAALGGLFIAVYTKGKNIFPNHALRMTIDEAPNTQGVATMLYGQYMFAFEIASLLLLVAIIGAVVMAKRRI